MIPTSIPTSIPTAKEAMSRLFTPLQVRGVTSRNRVMVSPMCMYAAPTGAATDFHLVHLGRFALGGAGIVMLEGTAVTADGRISHLDLGLWNDEQADAVARVAAFLSAYDSVPAIQLAHAGRKAACAPAWAGAGPLTETDPETDLGPWPTVGPSAVAAGPGWQVPHELTLGEIQASIEAWAAAAERAVAAGFKVIELHGAHGYLLHSFQSPVSNFRADGYGGDAAGRWRYPLEVVRAIRAAVGDDVALFYRVSAVDGVDGGNTLDDTIHFVRALRQSGVDLVDVSSGGIVTDRSVDTRVRRGFAFHADFSRVIREEAGLPVATVGLIVDAAQAEAVLASGDADIVALGRELLEDPSWPHHARRDLLRDYEGWHREAGWAVAARSSALARLKERGETPMSRYGG
jgi:2,4-dienoyl-CoA reductase-like NADH-dependent reductase (Old Yellow Enzyme family)